MVVRRVLYRLLFPMAFALPVWVFVARGLVLDGLGWESIFYLIVAPVLFLGLLFISVLVTLRPGIRSARAVSWLDVAVLGSLWLTLIVSGFVAHPVIAVIATLLLIAAFWVSVWQLITEGRRRVQAVMDDIDATTRGARASVHPPQQPVDIGEVIVVTSQDVAPPRVTPPPRGDAAS